MKTVVTSRKKKQKNPTTNYPKDSHAQFCKRCKRRNGETLTRNDCLNCEL